VYHKNYLDVTIVTNVKCLYQGRTYLSVTK